MSSRTQQTPMTYETSHGTWYSVRNLSGSGYNYLVIDLTGDKEYEVVQATFNSVEAYAHFGQLYFEWVDDIGDDHANMIQSNYYTQLEPFCLERTARVTGPARLVFKTYLDSASLGYLRCFIRVLGVGEQVW